MTWSRHPPLPLRLNLKLSSTLANNISQTAQTRRAVVPAATARRSDWMFDAFVPNRRIGAEARRRSLEEAIALARTAA